MKRFTDLIESKEPFELYFFDYVKQKEPQSVKNVTIEYDLIHDGSITITNNNGVIWGNFKVDQFSDLERPWFKSDNTYYAASKEAIGLCYVQAKKDQIGSCQTTLQILNHSIILVKERIKQLNSQLEEFEKSGTVKMANGSVLEIPAL